jgi:hypothetical protein
MKKLTMCMLLLFCVCAFAQTDMNSGDKNMSGKKTSMTGCMMEKDGHMMMMNKEHPDGVMMMGSMDMKAHTGHMMKATGTMGMMGDDGKMMMGDDKMKSGKGMIMMQVDSMKMMKSSCDMAK